MAAAPSASAIRALALEYKSLAEDPVEGFRVKLLNDEDMFLWEVALFGPPDTLYQGGYFKVRHKNVVGSSVMWWDVSALVVGDTVDGDGGVASWWELDCTQPGLWPYRQTTNTTYADNIGLTASHSSSV